jgi:hypothetical protein
MQEKGLERMIQVKTFRRKGGFWKDENLPDYEKRVNEFCASVKVIGINSHTSFGTIHHTVIYETEK